MNSRRLILTGFASLFSGLLFAGCTSTDYGHTSPYHPGPVVGKTVGNAAGVVAGNAVGLGVGTVEAWPSAWLRRSIRIITWCVIGARKPRRMVAQFKCRMMFWWINTDAQSTCPRRREIPHRRR